MVANEPGATGCRPVAAFTVAPSGIKGWGAPAWVTVRLVSPKRMRPVRHSPNSPPRRCPRPCSPFRGHRSYGCGGSGCRPRKDSRPRRRQSGRANETGLGWLGSHFEDLNASGDEQVAGAVQRHRPQNVKRGVQRPAILGGVGKPAVSGGGMDHAVRRNPADSCVHVVGDEEIPIPVCRHSGRIMKLCRGSGSTVAGKSGLTRAGESADGPVAPDLPYAVVEQVGYVEVSLGIESQTGGLVSSGLDRRTAVSGISRRSVACDGADQPGGGRHLAHAMPVLFCPAAIRAAPSAASAVRREMERLLPNMGA
jgi:hypothetical protein